jgi:hypothetical protein
MQAAMRPYVAAGAALLGASVVAVNPAVYPDLERGQQHVSNAAVRLASADAAADVTLADLANIPYNFIASIVNLPYYYFADPISTDTIGMGSDGVGAIAYTTVDPGVDGMPMPETSLGAIGLLDNVLNYEGNFWLLDSLNVLGIDPGDPGKIAAFADLLSGNPAVGSAVSGQLIPILEAELPLQAGCTAASAGGCPDPLEILMGSNQSTGFDGVTSNLEVPGYLSVPIQDFFSSAGYTFPGTNSDPLLNPVPSGEPIPPGLPPGTPTDPIPTDPTGTPPVDYATLPWSGENVNFNDMPNASTAYFDYLTQNPADNPIMFPSLTDVTTDLDKLATGLFNTFNPFVNGTYCYICAPFVPGDNDLSTFLTSEYQQIVTNFGAFVTEIESFAGNPGGAASSLLTEAYDNLLATLSTAGTDFGSLSGGAAATEISPLLDTSALSTELTSLFDPSTLTTDLSGVLGNSATELTALLGAGVLPDMLTTILPDIATMIPF